MSGCRPGARSLEKGALTFEERLEIPYLLQLSINSFKISQGLRLLIVVTWSVGACRTSILLLSSRSPGDFSRLLIVLISILVVVANAGYVAYRLRAPAWKRIHDERVKVWSFQVTAIGCLVGSVLYKHGENDMASPLGNSLLLSVTLVFNQIRFHITARLLLLQLLSLQLMECGRWYTMAGESSSAVAYHVVRDTAVFVVLGGFVPLMYLAGMEARSRLKFLQQHGLPSSGLQPFWQSVLRLQAYDLRRF